MLKFFLLLPLALSQAGAVLAAGSSKPSTSTGLINPLTRFDNDYSLPDQHFPGLQSNFRPPIDSGEKTYVGHGRLRGRRALITGGDSGIGKTQKAIINDFAHVTKAHGRASPKFLGRAVAIAYAREGADVAINYLPEEQADADVVRSLVEAEGRKFFALPGDLLNETFCTELISVAAKRLGGLDILVSNAGYGKNEYDIRKHSTETFERTYRTNVFAAFFLSRAAVEILPPGSSIIFTVSQAAARPSLYLLDYSATKAALVQFAKALAAQIAPMGIRVNGVAPGLVWSNFDSSQGWKTTPFRDLGASRTWKRAAQPVEMAPLYVTLAESVNSFTSGSIWAADGGVGSF